MELLDKHSAAIKTEEVVVLYLDECHLLWDDARGYVWGKASQRITIPMANFRERQTYYGALEYTKGEVTVHLYSAGNGEHTVAFIEKLRQKYLGKRLVLLWDGASYHKGQEMVEYLAKLNHGQEGKQWPVTCCTFAPYAPEQNPIEHLWLKAKQYVRKNWHKCNRFQTVKALFQEALENQCFIFPKLHMYGLFS